MKQEIILNIDKETAIIVTGEIIPGEPENNIRDGFDITQIETIYKDVMPLLEWANSKPNGSILEIIEGMVLEKL